MKRKAYSSLTWHVKLPCAISLLPGTQLGKTVLFYLSQLGFFLHTVVHMDYTICEVSNEHWVNWIFNSS